MTIGVMLKYLNEKKFEVSLKTWNLLDKNSELSLRFFLLTTSVGFKKWSEDESVNLELEKIQDFVGINILDFRENFLSGVFSLPIEESLNIFLEKETSEFHKQNELLLSLNIGGSFKAEFVGGVLILKPKS